VEVGGARFAVAAADLQWHADGWKIADHPRDPNLHDVAGRDAELAFTLLQVSVFFSAYVFFQVWNLINCRSLTPSISGLRRLWHNPTFLAIASIIAIGQIMIVTVGGSVFNMQPLGPIYWLAIIAGTASTLAFGEVVRRARNRRNAS
jgi:Ca2+-transporting ATPase